jgi:hypothetical protein
MYTTSDRIRFLSKVQFPADPNGCWIWNGAKHGQGRGYGKFRLGGRMVSAHKAAYLLFEGTVAPGLVLGHQCNNERCCNPRHLKAETQSSNMAYCVASGRHPSQRKAA